MWLGLTYGRVLFLENGNYLVVECVEQFGGVGAHVVKIEVESVKSWY